MHVECFNYDDFTKAKELCAAVADGNMEKAERLLLKGANPNILVEKAENKAVPALEFVADNHDGMTALLRKFGAITMEEYINEE